MTTYYNMSQRKDARTKLDTVTLRFDRDSNCNNGVVPVSEVIAKLCSRVYTDGTIAYSDLEDIKDLVDPVGTIYKTSNGTYKCSVCYTGFPNDTYIHATENFCNKRKFRYCPNCGARLIRRDISYGMEDDDDSNADQDVPCEIAKDQMSQW